MNTQHAKQIPLSEVMQQLGYKPSKTREGDIWYTSPFRDENTPSFKINTHKNTWYDFGQGEGGSIIDLFMQLYNDNSVAAALEKIASMHADHLPIPTSSTPTAPTSKKAPLAVKTPVIQSINEIKHRSLVQYLNSRAIDTNLARLYMSEIHYQLGNKTYFALGQSNQNGGFELRNPYFKGSIGNKHISYFP